MSTEFHEARKPPPDPAEGDTVHPVLSPSETAVIIDWRHAQAVHAAALGAAAFRLGALDQRLRHGPPGWRQRLAFGEAAGLSWLAGDRVPADRLALWAAMRLTAMSDDSAALTRAAWALRRLAGGPPPASDLPGFLGRRDPDGLPDDADRLHDRAQGWLAVMEAAPDLHPIIRAAMGYHLWPLAGLSPHGGLIERAVTAARIAAGGTGFAPQALGGAGGLRATGTPADRLGPWLDGIRDGAMAALRQIDDVAAWSDRARAATAGLSGRTPPALCEALAEWPFLSAPMAETLTGASRAAVQRNLSWMERHGLIREITGQGRFRIWAAAV